ncbi:MAG: anhydro-N-acetylmuramic acid kinase [Candidatus Anammoxibacter sp.]
MKHNQPASSIPYPSSGIHHPTKRLVAGCMTGTSIDGLDIALVEIEGYGLDIRCSVKRCISKPLGDLSKRLRLITQRMPITAKEIAQVAHGLSILHLDALKELIDGEKIDLVSVHGQTVYHAPPLSLQMINPTPIAIGLNVPVVTDLRAADIAHGGQGAPITPIADFLLYRSNTETQCIVNLGGFCNLTLLQKCPEKIEKKNIETVLSKIKGQDVCACNQILDTLARRLFKIPFDVDGKLSSNGSIKPEPFDHLESHLKNQAARGSSGSSLGTGDELISDWIRQFSSKYSSEDLVRSASAAIASTVVFRCKSADRIILAGGGVKNKTLVAEITKRSGIVNIPVELSDEKGIPSTHREAVAMSVLGALCQDRVPITLRQVTGASSSSISGVWVLP